MGIAETQEMIDFCAEKNVLPDIEMIAMRDINEANEPLLSGGHCAVRSAAST